MNFAQRFPSLAVAAGLAVFAAHAQTPAQSDWNLAAHIPLDQVVVQSHRGAGYLAEENTVAAFELGWKLGTTPECDLRTTADGVIVTFHDANFARVVKDASPELAKKGVKDLTFAELLKLDVGAWRGDEFVGRKVSKLADTFEVMRGRPERRLYLDIKHVDLPQLAREVRAHGVERQVIFTTTKPELIAAWKELVPDSGSLLWMRGNEADLRQRIGHLRAKGFPGITQLQIHIFPTRTIEEALKMAAITADRIKTTVAEAKASPHPFTVSNAFLIELGRELRARGILFQALPYTSDVTVCRQLFDLGVASIATDYPDAVLREVRDYYARKQAQPVEKTR